MQINKKILFIALCISFHGAVKSMQEAELKQHADTMSVSLHCIEDGRLPRKIANLATWLLQERNKISNENEWKNLIETLNANVTIPAYSHYSQGYTFRKVHWEVIVKHALNVQQGQIPKQLLQNINDSLYNIDMGIEISKVFLGDGSRGGNPFFTQEYLNEYMQ